MGEVAFYGLRHERQHSAVLLAARFDHAQQTFHEPAPRCALRSERQLPPNHRVTQRPLRRIVRRRHPRMLGEQPQLIEPIEQIAAQRRRRRMTAPLPVLQNLPQRVLQPMDVTAHRPAGDRSVPRPLPVTEHLPPDLQQSRADPFPRPSRVDQRLKVPQQMRPAHLPPLVLVVPAVAVGRDRAAECLAPAARARPVRCASAGSQTT